MSADELGRQELAWKELLRTTDIGDLEGAFLRFAEAAEPKVLRWQEVKGVLKPNPTIEFVEPLDDETPVRHAKFRTEEGEEVEGFIPAELPDDGLHVRIAGHPGILFVHPGDGEVHLEEVEVGDEEDDEQAAMMKASEVTCQIVGYNHETERQLYGFSIGNDFAAALDWAWNHVEDHDCEAGNSYLSRFVEQLVKGIRAGQAKMESEGL